jgi:hypothetical protein
MYANKINTLEDILGYLDLVTEWVEAKILSKDFNALDPERLTGALLVLEHAAYKMEALTNQKD